MASGALAELGIWECCLHLAGRWERESCYAKTESRTENSCHEKVEPGKGQATHVQGRWSDVLLASDESIHSLQGLTELLEGRAWAWAGMGGLGWSVGSRHTLPPAALTLRFLHGPRRLWSSALLCARHAARTHHPLFPPAQPQPYGRREPARRSLHPHAVLIVAASVAIPHSKRSSARGCCIARTQSDVSRIHSLCYTSARSSCAAPSGLMAIPCPCP
jgi:hypothetical protein